MMSDTNGAAAPAPASTPASTPAPADTTNTDQPDAKPQPVRTEPTTDKPEVKRPTTREALEKAKAKVEAENPEPKPKAVDKPVEKDAKPANAKPVAKEPAQRAEHGHFAPKAREGQEDTQGRQAAPAGQEDTRPAENGPPDMPKRFNAAAAADWDKVPDSVKAETNRMQRELEQGVVKYKEAAERDFKLEPFHKMAKESGTELPIAVDKYVKIENAWRQNPVNGFLAVCGNLGVDPLPIAKMVYEVIAGEVQAGRIPQGREAQLLAENAHLKAGQSQAQQQRVSQEAQQTVVQFMQQGQVQLENGETIPITEERFDELGDEIVKMIESGYASDLQDAYVKAHRLIPDRAAGAQPARRASDAGDSKSAPKASGKSIAGAPSAGSDPAVRREASTSIRESLERAAMRAGG